MYVMSPKIFEKVQKKLGEKDVVLAPPIILLGEHLLPLFPLFPRLRIFELATSWLQVERHQPITSL